MKGHCRFSIRGTVFWRMNFRATLFDYSRLQALRAVDYENSVPFIRNLCIRSLDERYLETEEIGMIWYVKSQSSYFENFPF